MIEPHSRGRPRDRAAPVRTGAWESKQEADRIISTGGVANTAATRHSAAFTCTVPAPGQRCPTCRAWAAAHWHIAAAARFLRVIAQ